MRVKGKVLGLVTAATIMVFAAAPAGADTQTVTATIGSSVSISTSPTATISNWSLAATGANTTSGGQLGVTANVAYTVTVVADKAKMSEYDTSTSAYVTGGATLTNGLSIVPTLSSGVGVPVASVTVGTTAQTLATSAGLTTDVYNLTLSQPTVIGDKPLATGKVYRIVITYTAAATV